MEFGRGSLIGHESDLRETERPVRLHIGIRREQHARRAVLKVLPRALCGRIHDGQRFHTLARELVARHAELRNLPAAEGTMQTSEQSDKDRALPAVVLETDHSIAVDGRKGEAGREVSRLQWPVRCCGHVLISLDRSRSLDPCDAVRTGVVPGLRCASSGLPFGCGEALNATSPPRRRGSCRRSQESLRGLRGRWHPPRTTSGSFLARR